MGGGLQRGGVEVAIEVVDEAGDGTRGLDAVPNIEAGSHCSDRHRGFGCAQILKNRLRGTQLRVEPVIAATGG